VRIAKIQLKGQLTIDRRRTQPLCLQVADQLQGAIEGGTLTSGAQLPSTRALARTLGLSRNTVLAAYDELTARGCIRGRRGSGMYVLAPAGIAGFDLRAVMREAHFPSRRITVRDMDGNSLYLTQ